MGSRAECWVGKLNVGVSKGDIDPSIMRLFRRSDKVVISHPESDLPPTLGYWTTIWQDDPELTVVYYIASVGSVRDRLELFGYTLKNCQEVFRVGVESSIDHYTRLADSTEHSFLRVNYLNRIELLRTLTYESWQDNLKKIIDLGLATDRQHTEIDPHEGTVLGYMLSENWFGFPGPSSTAALRAILDTMEENESVVYDLTDLIWSDYFDADEDFVEVAHLYTADDFSMFTKIIVLTEGRTDAWILANAMEVLFPHLRDFFSFMEFEDFKVSGGAGNLVNLVKAFAGAGIVNRIIAIFDNDTASESALSSLQYSNLPDNIKVLKLPDLDFLHNYPTIGPSGTSCMDINGLAASIELFLGEEVLRDSSGSLMPVQWTGYNSRLERYQGEILEKAKIQERFRTVIRNVKRNPKIVGDIDWSHIRLVLNCLFTAFHEQDGEEIQSHVRKYFDR